MSERATDVGLSPAGIAAVTGGLLLAGAALRMLSQVGDRVACGAACVRPFEPGSAAVAILAMLALIGVGVGVAVWRYGVPRRLRLVYLVPCLLSIALLATALSRSTAWVLVAVLAGVAALLFGLVATARIRDGLRAVDARGAG